MARKPRALDSFPQPYFDALQRCVEDGFFDIPFTQRSTAETARYGLWALQKALMTNAADTPLGKAAKHIRVSLRKGETIVRLEDTTSSLDTMEMQNALSTPRPAYQISED